ncbi:MAG TPA: hypothetical protein VK435_03195 [Thermodesulfovibrionales bacterium]|nr:hypothetical protein [Thermodesulfovibrionales bacterium]
MMTKRALLAALFLVSLSGLMLHYRIHSFMVPVAGQPGAFTFDGTRFLSFIFPLVDLVLVTVLFTSRRTAVYAYLLNGIIVIYGTVFMAHFSIAEIYAKSIPPQAWLIKSTMPDIALAWCDFFVGKALYDVHMKG